jgi:coenzyme F420-reducing hydrogenase delta subunit
MPSSTINIVAFCCNWCSYAGADLAGTTRLTYPETVKIIRVPCSCRVDETFVLRAFERGADGVIVNGCHLGDCHYSTGNFYTKKRLETLYALLEFMGMEKDRLRLEWISASEGAKFADTMNDFVLAVTNLGKNKRYGGVSLA